MHNWTKNKFGYRNNIIIKKKEKKKRVGWFLRLSISRHYTKLKLILLVSETDNSYIWFIHGCARQENDSGQEGTGLWLFMMDNMVRLDCRDMRDSVEKRTHKNKTIGSIGDKL